MRYRGLVCVLGLLLLTLSGCAQGQSRVAYIGAEDAKSAALEASSFSADGVEGLTASLSSRDGTDYYQVDFTVENINYRYEVDALTGVVIDSYIMYQDDALAPPEDASQADASPSDSPPTNTPPTNTPPADTPPTDTPPADSLVTDADTYGTAQTGQDVQAAQPSAAGGADAAGAETGAGTITSEDAEANALAHAGLSGDQVTFVKSKLDYDNGRQVYEVEFRTENYDEYEYEIDAGTGEVISYDFEAGKNTASSNGSVITEEKAKELALAQVPGASDGDIQKFKVDYDDGRTEYDGEIVYDGMKYEFEIDAYSGAFRSWEAEPTNHKK